MKYIAIGTLPAELRNSILGSGAVLATLSDDNNVDVYIDLSLDTVVLIFHETSNPLRVFQSTSCWPGVEWKTFPIVALAGLAPPLALIPAESVTLTPSISRPPGRTLPEQPPTTVGLTEPSTQDQEVRMQNYSADPAQPSIDPDISLTSRFLDSFAFSNSEPSKEKPGDTDLTRDISGSDHAYTPSRTVFVPRSAIISLLEILRNIEGIHAGRKIPWSVVGTYLVKNSDPESSFKCKELIEYAAFKKIVNIGLGTVKGSNQWVQLKDNSFHLAKLLPEYRPSIRPRSRSASPRRSSASPRRSSGSSQRPSIDKTRTQPNVSDTDSPNRRTTAVEMSTEICRYYLSGYCWNGKICRYQHIRPERSPCHSLPSNHH